MHHSFPNTKVDLLEIGQQTRRIYRSLWVLTFLRSSCKRHDGQFPLVILSSCRRDPRVFYQGFNETTMSEDGQNQFKLRERDAFVSAQEDGRNYFERITATPMFYSTMIVPPLITLVRLLIHRLLRSSTRRPEVIRQTIDAVGYTLSTHSEGRFISGSDRIFLFFVALYALMVNLIFSGTLFEDQLTQFQPPVLQRSSWLSRDGFT